MNLYVEDLKSIALPELDMLSGCNILVTGATGLVGSALIDLLMLYADSIDYEVYGGCRSQNKFTQRFPKINKRLHFFHLDVTGPICSNLKFQYIIHAASGATPYAFESNPVGVMKANLFGVANLLDYGIQQGLKRFVYVSSGEVYGENCPEKWSETDSGYVNTMSVRSCYPSSKRAAETLCTAYTMQYGVDVMVARLCHTYGPYFTEDDNRAYAQFIRDAICGRDIVLKSSGEQFRSWIYIVDCVSSLLYILLRGKSGEAYNVANNESNVTIRTFAELIAEIVGRKVIIDTLTSHQNKGTTPITKAVFDIKKIKKLGWSPQITLREGLEHTIRSRFNILD